MANILFVSANLEKALSLRLFCVAEGLTLQVNGVDDAHVDAALVETDGITTEMETLVRQMIAKGVPTLKIVSDLSDRDHSDTGMCRYILGPIESSSLLYHFREMVDKGFCGRGIFAGDAAE